MKIWLLEDGERTGPHEIFNVRDRISNGEVNADTLAWYEGVEGWVKLSEVPAYASNFSKSESDSTEKSKDSGISDQDVSEFVKQLETKLNEGLSPDRARPNSATFQNEPLHPIRRFFARAFDLYIYSIIVLIIKYQTGYPVEATNIYIGLLIVLPYLILDGLALSYFGATPGKWLLDISVRDGKGLNIKPGSAMIRSARIWVLGLGMMSYLAFLTIPLTWFMASKYGKFIWDIPKNNITECKLMNPVKIALYVVIYLAGSFLIFHFLPPEYKSSIENNHIFNVK